jgi:hypothetical protein
MQEERNPGQDVGDEALRFARGEGSDDEVVAHQFGQRDEPVEEDEAEDQLLVDDDDDEVEAHSMGRLSLPEDPNTRF